MLLLARALAREAVDSNGSRTDREVANIQDCFLGLSSRKLKDYGKHWWRVPVVACPKVQVGCMYGVRCSG